MELTRGIDIAGPGVHVEHLDVGLAEYVQHLGMLHLLLFGSNLVITSGNDGQHAPHSAHFRNMAVDLRTHDLSSEQQALLLHVLAYSAHFRGIGVFDERGLPAGPHIHLELVNLPPQARAA